jgi:hypothetical protein
MVKMIFKNWRRELEIYKLWITGQYSVRKIAEKTAIPLSSVWYYVRKFRQGRKPVDYSILDLDLEDKSNYKEEETPKRTKDEKLFDWEASIAIKTKFPQLLQSGRSKEAKDYCEGWLGYYKVTSLLDERMKDDHLGVLDSNDNLQVSHKIDDFMGKYPQEEEVVSNKGYKDGYKDGYQEGYQEGYSFAVADVKEMLTIMALLNQINLNSAIFLASCR